MSYIVFYNKFSKQLKKSNDASDGQKTIAIRMTSILADSFQIMQMVYTVRQCCILYRTNSKCTVSATSTGKLFTTVHFLRRMHKTVTYINKRKHAHDLHSTIKTNYLRGVDILSDLLQPKIVAGV